MVNPPGFRGLIRLLIPDDPPPIRPRIRAGILGEVPPPPLGGTLAISVQLALKICRALLDLLAAGSLGPRQADRIGTLDLDGGELGAKIVRLLL